MIQNMHNSSYFIINRISLSIIHNDLCEAMFNTGRILCVKLKHVLFVKVKLITVTYSDKTEVTSCIDNSYKTLWNYAI